MTKLNDAAAIYFGSQPVDRVYLGTELVWGSPPVPWTPASLFADSEAGAWYSTSPWCQAPDGALPATEYPDPVGRVDDLSGNGNHALQATVPARPIIPAAGLRLRSDFVDDYLQVAADTGASEARVNTPYGHYRARMDGTYRLPLNDATGMIVRDGITSEQQVEVSTYFDTPEVFAVFLSPDTSVRMTMYATGTQPTQIIRFVGANGVEVEKGWSRSRFSSTVDLATDGLTAPMAMVFVENGTQEFVCVSNKLTGSIPDLSSNAVLTSFTCTDNQLTGSIPDLSSNAALTSFICNNNQLTGSIPDLSNNTALTTFQCNRNQLTGSIPDLSSNAALTSFICSDNELTGSIPDLSNNTALANFQGYNNQLTGWSGGTISSNLSSFHARNNQLTEAAVDGLLAAFAAAGRSNGQLYLDDGGNAPPSATGLADRAILVSRGWTVQVNT